MERLNIIKQLVTLLLVLSAFAPVFGQQATPTFKNEKDMDGTEQQNENFVRISKITVDPSRLDTYKAFLREHAETAMRVEPGVLTLYAVSEKKHPNKFIILEIYADEAAYKSHIQTEHFQKYKQGTLDMVQELELVDSEPLIMGMKASKYPTYKCKD